MKGKWLPDMDLNHDKQIQSLLCYRYTIGQTSVVKVGVPSGESRRVFRVSGGARSPSAPHRRWPVCSTMVARSASAPYHT